MDHVNFKVGKFNFAKVSIEDLPKICHLRWNLARGGNSKDNQIYAESTSHPRIQMHRLIMQDQLTDDLVVDHINGDGLDNRRENLRVCTQRENNWNRKVSSANTSGYIGVYVLRKSLKSPWFAQIKKDGKGKYLGSYATKEEAARAYDKAAKELFGEFAKLNFP